MTPRTAPVNQIPRRRLLLLAGVGVLTLLAASLCFFLQARRELGGAILALEQARRDEMGVMAQPAEYATWRGEAGVCVSPKPRNDSGKPRCRRPGGSDEPELTLAGDYLIWGRP